jgi:hypothetical protein
MSHEHDTQEKLNEPIYQFFSVLEPEIKSAISKIIDSNIVSIKKPKKTTDGLSRKSDADYDGDKQYQTADKLMLCWNPDTDQVAVFEFPPSDDNWERYSRQTSRYEMTTMGCESRFHGISFEHRKLLVFIEAMHLIVRDKCDPIAVHRAMLNIREYRDGCASDMPGVMA